jgi:hypothetical protein
LVTNEEHERFIVDELERKQREDFKAGNRRTPLTNNILMLLGDLLQPQTTGFNHINMDMSFSFLDANDLYFVENSSFLVTWFNLWGLKKCNFVERNKLATRLIAKRSFQGKSMELFTSTVNVQKQEFKDNTEKKTGFDRLINFGKKQEGE